MAFLRRDERRAKHVPLPRCIPSGIRRHELGGLEHHVAVFLEHAASRVRSIDQLGEIDGMRLLPDEKYGDAGWALTSLRSDHLGPPRPTVALLPGKGARLGKNALVPGKALLEQDAPSPERKM